MRLTVSSGVLAIALLSWTAPASAQDNLSAEVCFGGGGVIADEGIATFDVGATAWPAERWGLGAWATFPGGGKVLFAPAVGYQHRLRRGHSVHLGIGPGYADNNAGPVSGPARRLTAPGRRHTGRQPQRRLGRRVEAQRQRHPPVLEVLRLVHQQHPHPQVHRQAGRRRRHHEAAADVHARALLGVARVVPQPDLHARLQRQPTTEREAPRALERRPHPAHRRLGRRHPARRAVDAIGRAADPQGVGLERQPEAAGPAGDQLASGCIRPPSPAR